MSDQNKILIIDDDPDYIDGIRKILENAEYLVSVAHNPKDGYQMLLASQYDLVLLDIMMGRGAEGIALARKLQNDPKLRNIPLLIITGIREQIEFLFPGQPVHPNFVDMDGLLEKPIEPKVLLKKVGDLIQLPKEKLPA
jgi:two-component system, OmpR family, alkaline phosphatase synthesis response regulator PhoP